VTVSPVLAAVFFALLASACSREASRPTDSGEAWRPPDTAQFSAKVDHPLVPLASVPATIFEGTERRFLVLKAACNDVGLCGIMAG
jgi:hypothetical protein